MGLEISEIILHPDWNAEVDFYDGDIAVLRLKKQVNFSRSESL